MKAALYPDFRQPIVITEVPDPSPPAGGIVLEVRATGVCRSDWHGWMGHDRDIRTPHVPGHEMAGVIAAVGTGVEDFREGDRVTLPFVCACGTCGQCASGNGQVCDRQEQPGFTHWGSFAEYVAIHYADYNLVKLPDSVSFEDAASLGCRFATAWRALVAQGRLCEGEWVSVHGAGGVGLAAVMIAKALGARPIAVDVRDDALALARRLGAEAGIPASGGNDVAAAIRDLTGGGANLSIDAFGSARSLAASIGGLAKRGRHVQVGLLTADERMATIPGDRLIADELEIIGSHGMQAARYPEMLELIVSGKLDPGALRGADLDLREAAGLLANAELELGPGVSVINRFRDERE